ncbi:multisubunit sodium/proton antiporter, MrpE subunit (TC 2.A.63.1) [Salinimicrobium catena]|uniref:Multisubunit sodium/proton antiporter, MrpE subunit (TC 2.A.63.1) n=1 Tax=Salinimicrobium catena TaxID=390640 RepID=A0A1H5JCK5_9FLAO|nr:Na+/H+ antiporter subunit E [Salinimicrobium catena]SDK86589.1 multisubunit sodium/proton antiporter, MrpE subunit (TC 2.A.63.1) [Salinimicrobium catena]SEE50256.1 multisubunit sodium/proton antiporter, MrpE subunit (TC 2.A.63.1) [Salinimicrobium catena]
MKNRFLANILLTFIWVALTGSFAFANVVFGFFLSYFLLFIITRGSGRARYFRLVPKVVSFFFFFSYELIKANIQVAWEVGTPSFHMKPGIVAVPLDVTSDGEITMLANLITLTPGTLSLDVSEDKKVLYVYSMYITNREDFIRGIKNGFEKRIIELYS